MKTLIGAAKLRDNGLHWNRCRMKTTTRPCRPTICLVPGKAFGGELVLGRVNINALLHATNELLEIRADLLRALNKELLKFFDRSGS